MQTIRKIVLYFLIFLTVWITAHVSVLLVVGLSEDRHSADAIVIFGNKVEENGEPSERLKSRLDKGLELFNKDMSPLIIVSGGFGKEGFDEALVMKEYLKENGVNENAIITDQNGNNTYQTAKNLAEIKKDKNIESIVIVSQYYHLLRAKMVMRRFGFDTVYSSYGKMFPELRDFYSIAREIVGYYVYLFKSYK